MIHPTAVIEEGAILGDNITIGAFVYIGSNVTIGEGTTIDSHAVIVGNTTIGKNNRIFHHAALGSVPQDLKFKGEEVQLIIGDNNTIREFTLFNPGTEGGGSVTKVGDGNLFMGYVHLGHDVIIGDNCILANAATLAGHVELGNHVFIGGLTPVHQFVKIGDYAGIAGASALSQDVPPFCMAEGNRAVLRGLNINLLRRIMDRGEIDALRSAYRELFEKGRPLQESAAALLEGVQSENVKKMCEFIQNSKRGIPFIRKENVDETTV